MIIVPHEDDEILMTAGIIEKAVVNNKKHNSNLAVNFFMRLLNNEGVVFLQKVV